MYLALRDGPRRFNQDFSCPDLLGILATALNLFRLQDYHLLRFTFPDTFVYKY